MDQWLLFALTVYNFLSLNLLRPESRKDLSSHQLLPVVGIELRVCPLIILALDISNTQCLKSKTRIR